ncbi:MAG: hypothetical protein LBI10_00645 [Deltaproteobacteria bacterium]|jgi:glycine cleavage system transcriptional repressor|nr:hypothetical protein [Deltaproteobacteria bacterium]
MLKIIVAIVGSDRPGLVLLVSEVLATQGGQIEEINQTTLKGQFAGLFAINAPNDFDLGLLDQGLKMALTGTGLSYFIAPPSESTDSVPPPAMEPYVISLRGAASPALIPGVTRTVASFEANIDNLRAVTLAEDPAQDEGTTPQVLVLEISVPQAVQQRVFRQALALTAEELGVEISLQHRDIFEALHRL